MKKTYKQPTTKTVKINTAKMIAASGNMSGNGLNMRISNSEASGDAESRRGGFWDDEEE